MLPADPSVKPPFFAVILPPVTRNIKRVERYDRRVKQKLSQFKDVHRLAVTNHGSLDPQQLFCYFQIRYKIQKLRPPVFVRATSTLHL